MPYIALPSTLAGMSSRGRDVRRMVKLSGFFSAGLVGTGSVAAAVREFAEGRAPAGRRVRDPRALRACTPPRCTPHCSAAAATSISFAAAPATRMPYSPVPRTAVDPPVTWKPNHSAIL